jgi:hypothetical protein
LHTIYESLQVIKRQQEKQLVHIVSHLRSIALAAGLPDIQAELPAARSRRGSHGRGRHRASASKTATSTAASSRGAGGRGASHTDSSLSDTSGEEEFECGQVERLAD